MKRLWFLLLVLFNTSAFADDHYYYVVSGIGNATDGVHYSTPDAACKAGYSAVGGLFRQCGYTEAAPYNIADAHLRGAH